MAVSVNITKNLSPGSLYVFKSDEEMRCLSCDKTLKDGEPVYMCEFCHRFEHRDCVRARIKATMIKTIFWCHEDQVKVLGTYRQTKKVTEK